MKKYRKLVLLIILFLTIGFAAINTVLDINGIISFGYNEEDFNVYFYNVTKDDFNVNEVISEDKKSITVNTSDLQNVGDKAIYNYTVANTSKNYDANVKIECESPTIESISLTNVFLNTTIIAGTKEEGTLTLEYLSETTEITEYTCTLSIEAIERTSLGEEFIACEYEVGTEWTYDYTGTEQEFVVPCDGTYKVELWGAQGGNYTNTYQGGKGAYTSGNILIENNKTLYVLVGGTTTTTSGGYNGGGHGVGYQNYGSGYGGGGATDIRLISEKNDTFESLASRINVAAGGAGTSYYNKDGYFVGINGNAGTINGENGSFLILTSPGNTAWGNTNHKYPMNGFGGTQTSGGSGGYGPSSYCGAAPTASFGNFGNGGSYGGCNFSSSGAGGGGGYYGGGSAARNAYSGGGGSSFISGHEGCDAITAESTSANIIHTGQSIHYSGMYFTNTIMIAGNETMPTHDGTSTMTGNTGNGYAKITLLSLS